MSADVVVPIGMLEVLRGAQDFRARLLRRANTSSSFR